MLLALLWAAQLALLYHRLGEPSWNAYWYWRGLYRPGIRAVGLAGGEYLPGYVFHPLSPSGAKWAFILAAGVYAASATGALWAIWRLSEPKRRKVRRSVRRALA